VGVLLATVLGIAAVGCGGDETLEGSVRITGSSTVRPILSTVAGRFATEQPFVTFDVDAPGTADGFTLFCDGLADITGASRPINDRERQDCESSGVDWVELVVGLDAIAVFTSTTNPATDCLTTAQLYALAGPEAQGRTTWVAAAGLADEVERGAGAALEARGAQPLVVVGPGIESGTRPTFIELAIAPLAEQREKAAALRSDTVSPSSPGLIVNEVGSRPGAIGFLGLSSLRGTEGIVTPVALDGGAGCVVPSLASVADDTYPLTRLLFVYVALEPNGTIPPVTAGLVDYLLSDEGFGLAEEAGALRLDDATIDDVRQRWADAVRR
jgi:phosphate transport system substrate-binding protein